MLKYIQANSIEELQKSPQQFQEGMVAYIDDKVYMYQNNEWLQIVAKPTDDGLKLNLYDLNKSIIVQLPSANEEEIARAIEKIDKFDEREKNNYYMLLCRDYNYYTIFHQHDDQWIADIFSKSVIDILKNIGDIISIDNTSDNVAIEIWMRIDNEAYCFYLFGYDAGIVECLKR